MSETVVAADEEPAKDTSRLTSLRSAFKKEGTVTAGNASKLNDGAANAIRWFDPLPPLPPSPPPRPGKTHTRLEKTREN